MTTKTYTSRRFAVYEGTFQAYKECKRIIESKPESKPSDVTHDAVLGAALDLLIAKLNGQKEGQK